MFESDQALPTALVSGLAGATVLTAAHQALATLAPDPPRLDRTGRDLVREGAEALGFNAPHGNELQQMALAGDIVSNSLYFALVGSGDCERPIARGALLGAVAGIGAVALPPALGLGRGPRSASPEAQALTVGLYVLGGAVAGWVYRTLRSAQARRELATHRGSFLSRRFEAVEPGSRPI